MALLELDDVYAELGNVPVLRGVSIDIEEGETVGLIGRNGAGKTTTFRTTMGMVPTASGEIRFKGEDITNEPSDARPGLGLSLAPEDRRLFETLTVRDNLRMAAWGSMGDDYSESRFDDIVDRSTTIFPDIENFLDRPADQLSGGQQKMVAISRAVSADPELLLLDEPFEGLAPSIREKLVEGITRIKDLGVTIVLAESNVRYASKSADHFYVIERGVIEGEIPAGRDPVEDETVQRIFEGV
ncbi:MAG: ABC transporter ATP-binding protein [Halanaeroarchaeum sp.]